MFSSIYRCLFIIVFLPEISTDSSNLGHLHTIDEIAETSYVVLDKSDVCKSYGNDNGDILIAIRSSPANRDRRDIHRRTWLIEVAQHRIPYIFVMGTTKDEELMKQLLIEDETYNDLLIGKPVDDYHNLTLKGIFLLDWTKTYCSNHWLLFVDDSAIVNIEKTIDLVTSVKNGTDRAIYCQIFHQKPIRVPDSIWYVPESFWKAEFYPFHCSGVGYLITPNTVSLLHQAATGTSVQPKLWIDNVFITGIVAEAISVKLIPSAFPCCTPEDIQLFNVSLVLGQTGKTTQLLSAWRILRGNSTFDTPIKRPVRTSMKNISQFNRQGHLLAPIARKSKTLVEFITETYYSYSFSGGIMLLVLIICLCGRKRSLLRKMNFRGKNVRKYAKM